MLMWIDKSLIHGLLQELSLGFKTKVRVIFQRLSIEVIPI
jgi:hypothetical protein